ncbi:hypothetical protein RJ641_001883 [Dillenia turbinata]|uniref:Pre-mRNA-processing factor 39 n=1 Tax=Dillenia turbinata TaxID=194707 RepID=A0AAN8VEX5_9MAGN
MVVDPLREKSPIWYSFKELVSILEDEMKNQNWNTEDPSEHVLHSNNGESYKDETSHLVNDLFNAPKGSDRSSALQKYVSIGEQAYQKACQLDAKISSFEAHIRRPYFHSKPLDVPQLENWHKYLDFVEMQGDFDWAVKLYERCLIPCANYLEFWMRYVEFTESKGGREIAKFALNRATHIFKSVPAIHHFSAQFKEKIRDATGARAAFCHCDVESDSNFVKNVQKKANMEKRLGDFEAACLVYKEAIELAAEKQKWNCLSTLYIHFARFKYTITSDVDAFGEILIDGIKHVPCCKLLLKELVGSAWSMGGTKKMNVLDSVISIAISQGPDNSEGLSVEDRKEISNLYLELVDLCGTIHEVRKAWNQHIKLFPGFVRIAPSYKHQFAAYESLRMTLKAREDNYVSVPNHTSPDHSSDLPIQETIQDPEAHFQEAKDMQVDQEITEEIQAVETDNNMENSLQEVSPITEQPEEETISPHMLSHDMMYQPTDSIDYKQVSQESSKLNDIPNEQVQGCHSGQCLEALPMQGLSLTSPNDETQKTEAPVKSDECEAPQATSMSNGCELDSKHELDDNPESSLLSRPVDSARIDDDSIGPTSPTSHQSPKHKVHTESWDRDSKRSDWDWHRRNYTNKAPRDNRCRSRWHSHDRQNQWRQYSPTKESQAEIGAQASQAGLLPLPWPNPQASLATAGNPAASLLPMQNVQQQSFVSVSQPQATFQPIAYPQGQISQYPGQQDQNMQSNQAHNQMWQYYYYQQLLLQQQQYQQHQLSQQQSNEQQLLQQQYQQRLQQQPQQLPQQHQELQQQQNLQNQLQMQQQQYYQQQQLQLQQHQFYQQQQLQQQQQLLLMQQQQQNQQLQQQPQQQDQQQLLQQLMQQQQIQQLQQQWLLQHQQQYQQPELPEQQQLQHSSHQQQQEQQEQHQQPQQLLLQKQEEEHQQQRAQKTGNTTQEGVTMAYTADTSRASVDYPAASD